jgi:hypothetical protein
MKTTFKIFTGICLLILFTRTNASAQGCVAIRSTGGICEMNEHADSADTKGYWIFNNNDRYYKSFRHFVGKTEQYQRIDVLHNNVINKVVSTDNSFTRVFNNRWSLTLDLPMIDNSRSQVSAGTRFSTHSSGIGDINATAYYWLLNPAITTRGNIQVGAGIKFATGTYDYQDYFLQADGSRVLQAVDQSIQPGDGGTGLIVAMNGYYNFTHRFGLYGNFFYLVNPRDVSGTPTSASAPSALKLQETSNIISVPDQMLIRFGASLAVNKWDFSLGVRDDALPAHDLVGGSDGFRRPGYIFSAEPGATLRISKNAAIYFYMPIAIIRDRIQSVPDIRGTEITGKYTQGDAAFADYVVNVGLTVKF